MKETHGSLHYEKHKVVQSAGTASSIHQKTTRFSKFNNVAKRVILGFVMVSGFLFLIYMGPILILFTALIVQLLCFREVIHIGYNYSKFPPSIPYFRSLCWYFVGAANYFLFGETIAPRFKDFYTDWYYLKNLLAYHRFFSFCLYFIGIVIFVLNLVRKYDSMQFRILGRTHILLIIIVLQSYMVIENIFQGLIWLILPVSLVTLNDIFAYLCGRIWGKTPLIEVSPKKTWEGFIGGVVGTFISGLILSNFMCQFQYLVCPLHYDSDNFQLKTDCDVGYFFTKIPHHFGGVVFHYYPFVWHFFALAFFASIVAPFGGFCASGFKRAFKIKDFGDFIPGHGGIMDRFDCQFLMATFVNVYIFTFVGDSSLDLLFRKILYLSERDQVRFYYMLRDSLEMVPS